MCLLATSVGPLLYSLQDLPFHLAECVHTLTRTHTHAHIVAGRIQMHQSQTGRWRMRTPATYTLPVLLFSPFSLVPTLICSPPPQKLQTPYGPPENCSTLPLPQPILHARAHTQTQTHTRSNKKSIGFPLLISGCHFSLVYLILSFCLYPSVVPPHLPAFVRNEGGHLSSMLPWPSSLSSQTTVVASVWLPKGETLFACVSVCEAVCVGLTAGTPS